MTDRWTTKDEERHQRLLEHARKLSVDEIFQIAVQVGIYTENGDLTPRYQDAPPESGSPRLV